MIIFNYGCPRSGTTFLDKMMFSGITPSYKIQEASPIHPIHSDMGLLGLAMIFYLQPVVFIRIKRNPVDIFESYYCARLGKSRNKGLKKATNDDVFRFIDNERRHTTQNRILLDIYRNKHNLEIYFVEIDYDKLHDDNYAKQIHNTLKNITGEDYYYDYIKKVFGKKSVREGRMSLGIKDSLVPDDIKELIKERYESELNSSKLQ